MRYVVMTFLFGIGIAVGETHYNAIDPEGFEYERPLLEMDSVSCTVYNAFDPNQGWGDCSITASGKRIDPIKLQKGEIKYIAISHDLREHFSFGDSVFVDVPKKPELSGVYYVEDLMAKRWTRKIDILTYDLKVGKWNDVKLTKL